MQTDATRRAGRGGAHPGEDRLVPPGRVDPLAARDEERVDRRDRSQVPVHAQHQPGRGAHSPAGGGGHGEVVHRSTEGLVGAGEHLVGAGDVQGLDAVEGEQDDGSALHPGNVPVPAFGINDQFPTDPAIRVQRPPGPRATLD